MAEKEIIIKVSADTSGVTSNINEVKQSLKSLSSTDVGGESVKSLKTQLHDANIEAQKIGETFGYNSKQFKESAKNVAGIKDKFEEYKQTVNSFNPDNKLQSIVSLGKGLTGAMAGATGAMAAFGGESEKNEEIIRRLQGLMAFSSALNGIDDIKNSFKNLGLVLGISGNKMKEVSIATKEQAVASEVATISTEANVVANKGLAVAQTGAAGASKTLGAALKSIGIGLIISAVVFLISSWDDLKDSMAKLFPFLDGIGEKFEKVTDFAKSVGTAVIKFVSTPFKVLGKILQGDFKGAIEEIKTGYDVVGNTTVAYEEARKEREEEAAKDALQLNIDKQKRQLEVLKAGGKDTYAAEKKIAEDKLNLAEQNAKKILKGKKELSAEEVANLSKDNKEKFKAYEDGQNEILVIEAKHQKDLADEAKKADEKRKERIKKEREEALKKQHDYDELINQLKAYYKAVQGIDDAALKDKLRNNESEKENELAEAKLTTDNRLRNLEDEKEKEKIILQKAYANGIIKEKELKEKQKALNDNYWKIHDDVVDAGKQNELNINKKYSDKIEDYIKGINAKQLNTYQQERIKINKEIDDLLKTATDAEKKLLESSRNKQLGEVDVKENLYKNTVSANTNLVTTKTENVVTDKDNLDVKKSKLLAINQAEREVEQAAYLEKLNNLKGNQLEIEAATAEHKNKLIALSQTEADIEKQIQEAKVQTISGALTGITALVGEQAVVGKGISIAQATMDTYTGATKALAQGGIFGYIGAAGIIATGIANIKKIIGTKVPNASDNTSSAASAISTAPVINSTALNPNSLRVQDVRVTNQNSQSLKAYIVDKDLKDNEARNNMLNKLSSY